MNKKYSGFTLVEMLIVMGIIIILTVVGITAGRFAIDRANDVAHRNAADQIYTSLQAYYTDNRKYPAHNDATDTTICGGDVCTVKELVGTPQGTEGTLVPYIDKDSFDGGTTATYYYGVGGDNSNQATLVCVTLRGAAAENKSHEDGVVYCAGNGFGVPNMKFEGSMTEVTVSVKEMTKETYGDEEIWSVLNADGGSEWNGETWEGATVLPVEP